MSDEFVHSETARAKVRFASVVEHLQSLEALRVGLEKSQVLEHVQDVTNLSTRTCAEYFRKLERRDILRRTDEGLYQFGGA